MTVLVERLRQAASRAPHRPTDALMEQAAEEIVRLNRYIDRLQQGVLAMLKERDDP